MPGRPPRRAPAGRGRARFRPDGSTSISSPARIPPATSVPVTTVPKPFSENTRSIGSRSSPCGRAGRRLGGERDERGAQRVETLARPRRDAHDRPPLQERARHQLADLELGDRLGVGVDEVALRQRDEAARDAEQPADVEVLARLRHHRLVGGDDQQRRVDAVRAGQHVAHEALVAGDVDEGGDEAGEKLGVGEAEVDRDAPLLLLLQAVGVGPGQRAHERALAVVDVAGRADDQRAQDGRPPGASLPGWSRRRPTRRSCGASPRARAAPPSRRGR